MPSGNHVVVARHHVARRANRKAHRAVVEVAVVKAEAQAAVRVAAARVLAQVAAVVQAGLITAARGASSARLVAHHGRSHPQARQAHVHAQVVPRAGNRAHLSTPADSAHAGLAQQRVEQPDGASGLRTVTKPEVRRVTA